MSDWYRLDAEEVLRQLATDASHGLSMEEARQRLLEYGPNELTEREGKNPWRIFWEQLTSTMVVILMIAAVVSALLGDHKDTVAILAIVVLNALLGFHQEYQAEKAMVALRKLAVPVVKVRRQGDIREISARDLVPGDIVLFEAGNLVPADCRLLQSVNLRIQEAALTGESEPVVKVSHVPTQRGYVPLAERCNMAYRGTVVTYGRAEAVVTETAMRTEFGRIAEMIQTVEREPTPMQQRLAQLGRGLALGALGLVVVVGVLGLLRGEEVRLLFLTAMSLAVAAVPEGLPAVVTIALALGSQRMLKRRALIRKLPAVETLGSVTVICSDKTGTLTQNRMTVTVIEAADKRAELTPGKPQVDSTLLGKHPALAFLLAGGALCNDALLQGDSHAPNQPRIVGDPTEVAMVEVAARFGLQKTALEAVLPRVAEVPFDSERKRMTTVHALSAQRGNFPPALATVLQQHTTLAKASFLAITKGAVGSVLEVSTAIWVQGQCEPLHSEWYQRIAATNDQLAQRGIRVLGVACRSLQCLPPSEDMEQLEHDLVWVGLIGMIDPPRPEASAAVQTCKSAGIRPIMITGDHPLTARFVARELDIASNGRILTGQEMASLSVEALRGLVDEVPVYARVSPEHKLHIVQALQDRGHTVAMTGDGVNDAPALRKANIGVAMGIIGTDVSKEAADMVLLDDNFATIVTAVEEGRIIYDNIRKFIKYTLTSNTGEIWVMLLAPLFGMPLPLLPLQILWVNLMTDGLPGLALSVEPGERDTMRRPPYLPGENIFARGMGRHIVLIGLLMGLVPLGIGYGYWHVRHPAWQTMVFTTLTLLQMGHALAIRSQRDSLFRIGVGSNPALLGAVALTFLLQLAVVYVPFLQDIFKTSALSAGDLVLALAVSTTVFWGVELEKWLLRRHATSAV